jgi:hypothetical protein
MKCGVYEEISLIKKNMADSNGFVLKKLFHSKPQSDPAAEENT